MNQNPQNINFKSLLNFRDIGGMIAPGNKIVKKGLIFRSANPDKLSRKDIEKLRFLHIRTIIDLRSPKELLKKPVSIDHTQKFTLPLDFQLATRERLRPFIYRRDSQPKIADISNDLYLEILDASIPVVGQVMDLLAAPEGTPVLIHCQAGKDRTGIVVAVILLALGVKRELIIEDFMKSNEALLPFFKRLFLLRKIISFGFFPYKNMVFAVTVRKRNIEAILDRIDDYYGGIEAFLRKAGIDASRLAEIKLKLLSGEPYENRVEYKDDPHRRFSLAERLKSFRYAFRGISTLLRYEHNARIHLTLLIIVILTGIFLRITFTDWMAILFVTGLVFISECFNTAVENLSDLITDKPDENIRRAKDVSAAAVLLSAIISVAVGLMIFIPAILKLVRR